MLSFHHILLASFMCIFNTTLWASSWSVGINVATPKKDTPIALDAGLVFDYNWSKFNFSAGAHYIQIQEFGTLSSPKSGLIFSPATVVSVPISIRMNGPPMGIMKPFISVGYELIVDHQVNKSSLSDIEGEKGRYNLPLSTNYQESLESGLQYGVGMMIKLPYQVSVRVEKVWRKWANTISYTHLNQYQQSRVITSEYAPVLCSINYVF